MDPNKKQSFAQVVGYKYVVKLYILFHKNQI